MWNIYARYYTYETKAVHVNLFLASYNLLSFQHNIKHWHMSMEIEWYKCNIWFVLHRQKSNGPEAYMEFSIIIPQAKISNFLASAKFQRILAYLTLNFMVQMHKIIYFCIYFNILYDAFLHIAQNLCINMFWKYEVSRKKKCKVWAVPSSG